MLLMLLFSVSIENFGFMVSTLLFFLKNVLLNSNMCTMHVNHLCVAVDLEKNSGPFFFFLLVKKFFQASKNDFGPVDVS